MESYILGLDEDEDDDNSCAFCFDKNNVYCYCLYCDNCRMCYDCFILFYKHFLIKECPCCRKLDYPCLIETKIAFNNLRLERNKMK
jgi:hypothetical protein